MVRGLNTDCMLRPVLSGEPLAANREMSSSCFITLGRPLSPRSRIMFWSTRFGSNGLSARRASC